MERDRDGRDVLNESERLSFDEDEIERSAIDWSAAIDAAAADGRAEIFCCCCLLVGEILLLLLQLGLPLTLLLLVSSDSTADSN